MPKSHTFQYIVTSHHLSCLLIYTHKYSFLSLWVVSWIHLIHELGLHLSGWSPSGQKRWSVMLDAEASSGPVTAELVWFCHYWNFTGFIRIKFSLIQIILTVIMLIWNTAIIMEMKYSIMQQLTSYNSNHCPVLAKIKPPWGTHQSSPPSCISTKSTQVLEKKKSCGWIPTCLR